MSQGVSDRKQLSNLLDGMPFSEVAAQYKDEAACFNALRDEAKRSLESFDAYLEFYEICRNDGPTELVESYLNRNGTRMLKNMVLRESVAGERYHTRTAAELSRRVGDLRKLGADEITLRSVVATIVEHIITGDEGTNHLYDVAERLLIKMPDQPTAGGDLLVRARFVAAVESLDPNSPAFDEHLVDLSEDVPDFRPDDDSTTEELLTAAEKTPWDKKEKVELCCSGFARADDPDLETTEQYLYYTARDIPERYRHDHRSTPYRGELLIAVRQFNCHENLFGENVSTTRRQRVQSYRNVVHGELKSGRRWRTQRDPNQRPDPNFVSAAKCFVTAAQRIEPVDKARYVKYLSRAFRHLATGVRQPNREFGPVRGWGTCRQIHQAAISALISSREETNNERITETIDESIALHSFYGYEAAAVIAFERGLPDEIGPAIDESFDQIDRVPVYVSTTVLEALYDIQKGLRHEQDREFKMALNYYQNVDVPELDLEQRQTLTKIKRQLREGNNERALNLAKEIFSNSSPVLTAVQYLTDNQVSSPSIKGPILEELGGADLETKWRFATVAFLASQIDRSDQAISDVLENLLFEL